MGGLWYRRKNLKILRAMRDKYSFSFPTMFLGAIYWAYRKCFLGALAMAVTGAALGAVNVLLAPYLGRVARMIAGLETVLFACLFYRVYRWTADRVYCKGAAKGLRGDALVDYMRTHGGTSMPAAIVAALILLVALFVVAMLLVPVQ